jgi:hypothetical protein
MKWIWTLLLAVFVSLGALAAATAYLAPLDAADEVLLGATLAAPVGEVEAPEEAAEEGDEAPPAQPQVEPVVPAGTEITPEVLDVLRQVRGDDGEPLRYVSVREFSFARWPWKWWFLLALAGLAVTGFMLRRLAKQSAMAPAERETAAPEDSLAEIRRIVESLRQDLPQMSDDSARLRAIVDRLGEVQKHHAVAFVDARNELRARLGVAGFAQLMDRFAGAERLINRAWSAAADGVLEEAVASLDIAAARLADTEQFHNQPEEKPA